MPTLREIEAMLLALLDKCEKDGFPVVLEHFAVGPMRLDKALDLVFEFVQTTRRHYPRIGDPMLAHCKREHLKDIEHITMMLDTGRFYLDKSAQYVHYTSRSGR